MHAICKNSPLSRLVQSIGTRLDDARPITGLGWQRGVETYELTCSHKQRFKGRRLPRQCVIDENVSIRKRLNPRHFCRVLAVSAPWMLEEWIEGETLRSTEASDDQLRECGHLLAELHRTSVPNTRLTQVRDLTQRSRRFQAELNSLVSSRLLSAGEARSLRSHVKGNRPALEPDAAIIHRDWCAENMVTRPDGRIVVIDNTTICLGAVEEDLARTCFRWPLDPRSWSVFAAGYGIPSALESFGEHFRFWMGTILVRSAYYRHSVGSRKAILPVVMLRKLLREWQGE